MLHLPGIKFRFKSNIPGETNSSPLIKFKEPTSNCYYQKTSVKKMLLFRAMSILL